MDDDADDDAPAVTAAGMRKVLEQEPAADATPGERNLRAVLVANPAYYREELARLERKEREDAALLAENLRLRAVLDQLEAERAELEYERAVRQTLAALDKMAARDGCCPICFGYVAPTDGGAD